MENPVTVKMDPSTGLPTLPDEHYWKISETAYHLDNYGSEVVWHLSLMKQRRFFRDKLVDYSALVPEYLFEKKRAEHGILEVRYDAYLKRMAEGILDREFKRRPEDDSRRRWLGEYPPKSIVNDGVTTQDLADDGRD